MVKLSHLHIHIEKQAYLHPGGKNNVSFLHIAFRLTVHRHYCHLPLSSSSSQPNTCHSSDSVLLSQTHSQGGFVTPSFNWAEKSERWENLLLCLSVWPAFSVKPLYIPCLERLLSQSGGYWIHLMWRLCPGMVQMQIFYTPEIISAATEPRR